MAQPAIAPKGGPADQAPSRLASPRAALAFTHIPGDGHRVPAGLRIGFSPRIRGNQPFVVASLPYVNTTFASRSPIPDSPLPHGLVSLGRGQCRFPAYWTNDPFRAGVPPRRSIPYT